MAVIERRIVPSLLLGLFHHRIQKCSWIIIQMAFVICATGGVIERSMALGGVLGSSMSSFEAFRHAINDLMKDASVMYSMVFLLGMRWKSMREEGFYLSG
jgi:hypothetical protein